MGRVRVGRSSEGWLLAVEGVSSAVPRAAPLESRSREAEWMKQTKIHAKEENTCCFAEIRYFLLNNKVCDFTPSPGPPGLAPQPLTDQRTAP